VATIKTRDGIEIYCKDWGSGQAIVFGHGWPLAADDWHMQMLFFPEAATINADLLAFLKG
jgi:non-heme chloroperoxidase